MFARTPVGGLLLEDVQGWTFTVQDGVITGKFGTDLGILRIATLPSNEMPQPVTHGDCLLRAAGLAGTTDPQPSDWKRSPSITGPYGSAHFDRGADRVYIWYCCRAPGVIVGTYACPADHSRTLGNRALRTQLHCMLTTAIFDRRVWGGDDELTKMLTALLGADDGATAAEDR